MEDENDAIPAQEHLLHKFWSSGKKWNSIAYRNAMDDNPLNMIQRAFESFSVEEQKKILKDQYGGEEVAEESTAFVNEKLQELEREMKVLSENVKKAYSEAIQQEVEHAMAAELALLAVETTCCCFSSGGQQKQSIQNDEDHRDNKTSRDKDNDSKKDLEFRSNKQQPISRITKPHVESNNFRLMFLRAEGFDARMAAKRISRYFKEKKELFGVEKLSKKIKQADLSATELEMLASGCFCSTGFTDSHGRLIVFVRRNLMDRFSVNSIRRSALYLFQILEDHPNWQRRGIVFVSDGRGDMVGALQSSLEKRLYPLNRMLLHALPFRYACAHICYDNMTHHFFLKLALVVVSTKLKSRIKTHYATTAEEIYASLLEYGIRIENLPLTAEFEFQSEVVEQFLETLQKKEEALDELPHWLTKEISSWL